MADKKIGANNYRFGRLSAFAANDVVRIWSYALLMLAKAPEDLSADTFVRAFPTFTTMVPRDDQNMALRICLGTVGRVTGDKTAPLVGASGEIMFDDFSVQDLYALVFQVLKDNELLRFFFEPPAVTSGAGQAAA